MSKRNPAKFDRCVEDVTESLQKSGRSGNAYAICSAAGTRNGRRKNQIPTALADQALLSAFQGNPRRRNPEDMASEAFELFHGYPPENKLVFDSMEHEHEVFAGIGELVELVIVPRGERRGIQLKGFKGAVLSMNEQGITGNGPAQLYIVGGDQSLDGDTLSLFGVDSTALHEQEVLGACTDIVYFTDKTHLGKDGGQADYYHQFGEDSAKKHMRILESPTATYHVTNKLIGLWGGRYTIKPEGITN